MDNKKLKQFYTWLMVKNVYPYLAEIKEEANIQLQMKDCELSNEKYIPNAQDFSQVEFKLSTVSFNNRGIELVALNKLAKAFGTENIIVSGDGHDYQLSEYTSDHESEIVLTINVENKAHLEPQYQKWSLKLQELKNQEKVIPKNKLKK
jgi:galactose-1-phosphate uridylyltransferase